jgi:hypothetical protein
LGANQREAMNLKRIIGYALIITFVSCFIRIVIFESPWYLLPISIGVGCAILAIGLLLIWLFNNDIKPKPLTEQQLLDIGFEKMPHFTVMNSLTYDLGRNRSISIGCVGTPNEMLFIREGDGNNTDDLVSLHNFDYDGVLTIDKVEDLIEWFQS